MKQMMHPRFHDKIPIEPVSSKNRFKDALTTIALLGLTVFLTEWMRLKGVEEHNLIMVYLLGILVISRVTSGYLCGILAALGGTVLCDILIVEPRFSFSFILRSPLTVITMLLASFLISALIIQARNQAHLATVREQRTKLLNENNEELLMARDVDTIVHMTMEYLIGHLARPVIFYTKDPRLSQGTDAYIQSAADQGDASVFHTEEEKRRVHRIFQSGGVDPARTFDDKRPIVYYSTISAKGRLMGLIGVACPEAPPRPGLLLFLELLSGQVAMAMELQLLSDQQTKAQTDAEKEKMRSTLLRAISHDLRTPLTSILGSSSTILEQKDMDREALEGLTRDIRENAQWLIRMVENILTITRISKDTMKVTKSPEAAEEVVAQSVSIVRKRFADWQIHVRVPDDLLMVPMDATLISQVIINLVENAVKNSPSGSLILVSLTQQGEFARFDICDNGWGIPEQVLDTLFEVDSPGREQFVDAARGIGIGLSICQAIVQAHDGTIVGCNREEGGARFTFYLPLAQKEPEEAQADG